MSGSLVWCHNLHAWGYPCLSPDPMCTDLSSFQIGNSSNEGQHSWAFMPFKLTSLMQFAKPRLQRRSILNCIKLLVTLKIVIQYWDNRILNIVQNEIWKCFSSIQINPLGHTNSATYSMNHRPWSIMIWSSFIKGMNLTEMAEIKSNEAMITDPQDWNRLVNVSLQHFLIFNYSRLLSLVSWHELKRQFYKCTGHLRFSNQSFLYYSCETISPWNWCQ